MKTARPWIVLAKAGTILAPVRAKMATVKKKVNMIMPIIGFGKPKTDDCQAFKMLEQLKVLFKLQLRTACGFLRSVNFSSNCIKDATKPAVAAPAIHQNFLLILSIIRFGT